MVHTKTEMGTEQEMSCTILQQQPAVDLLGQQSSNSAPGRTKRFMTRCIQGCSDMAACHPGSCMHCLIARSVTGLRCCRTGCPSSSTFTSVWHHSSACPSSPTLQHAVHHQHGDIACQSITICSLACRWGCQACRCSQEQKIAYCAWSSLPMLLPATFMLRALLPAPE